MNARTKSHIFYVFPVFLLISACIWTSSISGMNATLVPFPSDTSTVEITVTSEQTASPTIAAGSFDDFRLFAAEIAAALQDRDISFFDEYATASTWTCLGDETIGVCKDMPADTTLKGVPVTYDWTRYELPDIENYKTMWQTTFANHKVVKLVAIAHLFGENPFMPMAMQSSLAIVSVADASDPASIHEARVLFFENLENNWYLRGELVTMERAEAWLNNTCDMCYDMWAAWPK